MGKLQQRVALVTGGGRGIGRAIALAFAREGARVAVTARTAAELEEVTGGVRAAGVLREVKGHFGPVEILVNNAGIGSSSSPRPVVTFDDDFWELSLRLNLTVPYLLSKGVLPNMLAARRGRIINVASVNSKVASLHGAAYAASKHGLLGLTRTLALEVAADGITVNAICPGPVKTLMNDRRIAYDAGRKGMKVEELEKSLTPVGGRLDPDDLAPLAVYLASDEARMVTGQGWNIDGGLVMF